MIMMSRVEGEMRMRQQLLAQELQREQAAAEAVEPVVRVSGPPKVHSQFFARRFAAVMNRLKMQPA